MLGPKITAVSKYGGKTSMRFPLSLWVSNREFAKQVREVVKTAWEDKDDTALRFHYKTRSSSCVLRVERDSNMSLKISWF